MSSKPLAIIEIMGKKKAVDFRVTLADRSQDYSVKKWLAIWKHAVVPDSDPPIIRIPRSHAVFTKATPSGCLFSAADDYMQAWFGRRLDTRSDKDFFNNHPLTTATGTPQEHTLRVLQELIEPYGLRISRVNMAPGHAPTGDLARWMSVLGANPLAMQDYQTTNEDFASKVGMEPAEADRQFRFTFTDGILRPCIFCDAATNKSGVYTGGGHASYKGPRAHYEEGVLSLQIDWKEKVKWYVEPVFSDLTDKDVDVTLSLWDSLAPDGKRKMYQVPENEWQQEAEKGGWKWQDHRSAHQALVRSSDFASQLHKAPIRECFICDSSVAERLGANLCRNCWGQFLDFYTCGECGLTLAGNVKFGALDGMYRKGELWFLKVVCPWCSEKNDITCSPGSAAEKVGMCIRGEKPYDARTTSNRGSPAA